MSANRNHLRVVKSREMRPVAARGRKPNEAYRVHEHLTEDQVAKLLATLKGNRHGHRDWLIASTHVHMLRHSTGYALANRGMDTRRLQHFLGHASITNTVKYTAMSPEPFKDIWRD